jgi:hypothetical protein
VRPVEAIDEGYFVPTIPYAVGKPPRWALRSRRIRAERGRGLSLVPGAVRTAKDLMRAHYMQYQQVATDYEPQGRPITRSQMELVARAHVGEERLLLLNDLACDGAPCEQQEDRATPTSPYHERRARDGGVPHGALMIELVDAVIDAAADPRPARARLVAAAGRGSVVEVGAVLGMFHWNDRVADATGAPLDEFHRTTVSSSARRWEWSGDE